jgi:hypothetical protein
MRMTGFALVIIALAIAAPASAQPASLVLVEVADAPTASLVPTTAPYTDGGLVVPARPLKPGVKPLVSEFRIRAWSAPGVAALFRRVRVVVFAIRGTGAEQQIASVEVGSDQPVEIAATEQFSARRITLRVTTSDSTSRPMARRPAPTRVPPLPPTPASFRVGPYLGDVPTDPARRPWQPPPRGSR